MSTKNLLSKAAIAHPTELATIATPKVEQSSNRVKKTITLDPHTVKALHKLKAHISIEEDSQTDFGRIIDDAVLELLKVKGLSL
jgi:hypothetical protein